MGRRRKSARSVDSVLGPGLPALALLPAPAAPRGSARVSPRARRYAPARPLQGVPPGSPGRDTAGVLRRCTVARVLADHGRADRPVFPAALGGSAAALLRRVAC